MDISVSKEKGQTLRIGGFVPFTLVDYPEHISAIIFCQGCCWHCPYCHNPELIDINGKIDNAPSWEDILAFLKKRKGLLDAVVFSGGEPLLQPYLKQAVQEVKTLGFAAVLHTNGHNPSLLESILPDLEWVGMDVKAPFAEYHRAVFADNARQDKIKTLNVGEKVSESLDLLLSSGIEFECRTTLDPRILNKDMLREVARTLSERGVKSYAIQKYRKTDDSDSQPSNMDINSFFNDKELLAELDSLFPDFIVRQ